MALSDLLLARQVAVVCDSRANLLDPTSLACIASHVADACVIRNQTLKPVVLALQFFQAPGGTDGNAPNSESIMIAQISK